MDLTYYDALTISFNAPSVREWPGGKPPRTLITEALEHAFDQIVDACQPDLILEVGAFEADFSIRASVRHPSANIIAFEANPRVYARFLPKLQSSRVDYRHAAVSDQAGEIAIHIPDVIAGKQMPFENRMGSIHKIGLRDSQTTSVVVPATTLDMAIDNPFQRAVLWLDVEGAADKVIAGGARVLKDTMALMLEVETSPVWKEQVLADAILADLSSLGFKPILRDCQKWFQHNLICVRSNLHNDSRVICAADEYMSFVESTLKSTIEGY